MPLFYQRLCQKSYGKRVGIALTYLDVESVPLGHMTSGLLLQSYYSMSGRYLNIFRCISRTGKHEHILYSRGIAGIGTGGNLRRGGGKLQCIFV